MLRNGNENRSSFPTFYGGQRATIQLSAVIYKARISVGDVNKIRAFDVSANLRRLRRPCFNRALKSKDHERCGAIPRDNEP